MIKGRAEWVIFRSNSNSNMARSTSKLKTYNKMGTMRSDSSGTSKRFKFRQKIGKKDGFVQTDKKMFDVILLPHNLEIPKTKIQRIPEKEKSS